MSVNMESAPAATAVHPPAGLASNRAPISNALTFDIEDWRPLADEWIHGIRTGPSGWVPHQVDRIRRILDRHNIRATFFWLGWTAEFHPDTVLALARDGHEIASHGYSHRTIYALTPDEFEADVVSARNTLASITGCAPRGFRAPQFSITRQTWWALGILTRLGFEYDSSIFPIRHRRYGVSDFERHICRIATEHGAILEIPLATVAWHGLHLPVAGGGYFRLLPETILLRALKRLNAEQLPFVTYFHPYEYHFGRLSLSLSASGVRMRARTWLFEMLQNLGRRSMPYKLEALLRSARFEPCAEVIKTWLEKEKPEAANSTVVVKHYL